MARERHLPQLESLQRISKIPVVETGVQLASGLYVRIKNSNSLMRWYLDGVEGSVSFVIDRSLTAVPLLELPLTVADTIVCKGLDTVQQKVPAINYPPEKLINKTRDYVSTTFVQPVLKRAESAKELTIYGATKYGELAASRIDTALDIADQYVEKYLPDVTDSTDGKAPVSNGESKTIQTIEHVNRLSRKLQRRLTKRTIAEAKALRQQGVNAAQILLKLAELMIKDPKQFVAKIKSVWEHLSQDEPENQVPPANLEQLIAMITRETARRFVHITNYTVKKASQLPRYTRATLNFLTHQASIILDEALKTVHLDRVKEMAVSRAQSEIRNLNITLRGVQILIENLVSGLLLSSSSSPQSEKRRTDQTHPLPFRSPLSPVAQSPERTPSEPLGATAAHDPATTVPRHSATPPSAAAAESTKPQAKGSTSPKKQSKKNKTPPVNTTSQIPTTPSHELKEPVESSEKHEDENRNNQEIPNGDPQICQE